MSNNRLLISLISLILLAVLLVFSIISIAAASLDAKIGAYTVAGDYVLDGKTLVAYIGSDKDIVIPADLGITKIGDGAFEYTWRRFNSIVIPEGVTSIGKCAFLGCEADVVLPNSISEIGAGALASNRSILTTENLKKILPFAFVSGTLWGAKDGPAEYFVKRNNTKGSMDFASPKDIERIEFINGVDLSYELTPDNFVWREEAITVTLKNGSTVKFLPPGAVATSSNPDVAEARLLYNESQYYDSRVFIIGKKAGKATISLTEPLSGKSVSCNVTFTGDGPNATLEEPHSTSFDSVTDAFSPFFKITPDETDFYMFNEQANFDTDKAKYNFEVRDAFGYYVDMAYFDENPIYKLVAGETYYCFWRHYIEPTLSSGVVTQTPITGTVTYSLEQVPEISKAVESINILDASSCTLVCEKMLESGTGKELAQFFEMSLEGLKIKLNFNDDTSKECTLDKWFYMDSKNQASALVEDDFGVISINAQRIKQNSLYNYIVVESQGKKVWIALKCDDKPIDNGDDLSYVQTALGIRLQKGDVNCDSAVNIEDILLVRDAIFGEKFISTQGYMNLELEDEKPVTINEILFVRDVIFGA